eukprot:COSAG02_NODE_22959_length_734_cov_1.253543_2_plen_97_part_00
MKHGAEITATNRSKRQLSYVPRVLLVSLAGAHVVTHLLPLLRTDGHTPKQQALAEYQARGGNGVQPKVISFLTMVEHYMGSSVPVKAVPRKRDKDL